MTKSFPRSKRLARLFLALFFGAPMLLAIVFCLYRNTWQSKDIKGQITDEGGNGIPNAVVVVAWQAHRGGGSVFTLELREALTNETGQFKIDAWGPKFSGMHFYSIFSGQPEIFVAKEGFLPHMEYDADDPKTYRNFDVTPIAPNKIIRLEVAPNFPDTRTINSAIGVTSQAANLGFGTNRCLKQLAPHFTDVMARIENSMSLSSRFFLGRLDSVCSMIH